MFVALTCVNSDVVFVVCSTGEGLSTPVNRTHIGPLSCVNSNVNFAYVRCGKSFITAFKWAFKWLLSCKYR